MVLEDKRRPGGDMDPGRRSTNFFKALQDDNVTRELCVL